MKILGVGVAVALLALISGVAFMVGGRLGLPRFSAGVRVTGSSVSFLVANLLLVPWAVALLLGRSLRQGGRGLGLFAMIVGGLSVLLGVMERSSPEVEHLWWWLIPILSATGAGLVICIMGGSPPGDSRTARDERQHQVAARRRSRITEAVEQVPPDGRARVTQDLRQAVVDLADRGLIEQAEAERALAAPLGGLSHHMAQRGG